MKAIIPVAGHGTRLEPHTLRRQKCLLPVAGKPVLEHILNRLLEAKVTEITLIIGHLGEQVKEYCNTYTEAKFTFVEQTEQMGLGHAVYLGLDQSDEPVVIVLGDSILELDYNKLLSSSNSTIGVDRVSDPQRFGIVQLDGDQIISVVEKPDNPPSNLALIGIYYISSQKELAEGVEHLISNDFRTKNEYQLTDAFGVMIERGHVFTALNIDACFDCGIPDTILSTNRTLLKKGCKHFIHPTAIISNSDLSYCTISENCEIINTKLSNVIMLPGSKVINQHLENKIVGYDECLESEVSCIKF